MEPILKVFFLPLDQNENNPYQKQLIKSLLDLDIQVDGSKPSSFFLLSAIRSKVDVVHLHWLHSYFVKSSFIKSFVSAFIFILELLILKLLGVKIVWTVHNLKNHENKYLMLDYFCTSVVIKISHALLAHCEVAKKEIIKLYNLENCDEKIFVVPHGNYIGCYPNTVTQIDAKQKLNLESSKIVFLFFGLIRPYKGVLELIDAFNQLNVNEAHLLIVGKIWNNSFEEKTLIEQKVVDCHNIQFIPGFVQNDTIQLYLNASDVVVFPYRDILTSGAVMLATSFGRACIAPKIGCIPEVLDDVGSFLYDPSQSTGLFKSMEAAIRQRRELPAMSEHNLKIAKKYSWGQIGAMTLKAYEF